MGCKLRPGLLDDVDFHGFNRNIMGCKCRFIKEVINMSQ